MDSLPTTIFTKVGEIKKATETCLNQYNSKGLSALSVSLHLEVLSHKIRFPLLERCAMILGEEIPTSEHFALCRSIAQYKTMGGNVLIGILLQQRMRDCFAESMAQTRQHIAYGAEWYVCDIIGERVYGVALLQYPEAALAELQLLSKDTDPWVVRSIGPGAHYAIKKGLPKQYATSVFELLLSMAQVKNKEIKQGIGWAAKTTAKFHPDIVAHFRDRIDDKNLTGQWFRTKVRIGLERNAYAQRNKR